MNEAIKKQIKLIEEIIAIGKKIPSDIDELGKITLPDDKEDLEKAINLNYQKFYIENFFNFADFLLEKIKGDEKKNFQYYIPLLRVFMEIYLDLLFLVNQAQEKQALICASNHLYTLARYIQFESGASLSDSKHLELLYIKELKQSEPIIKNIGIPRDPKKLSKKFMGKNGLLFLDKETITKKYFINDSVLTRDIFKSLTETKFYESYRTLSDYVHGSIFSMMQKDSPTVNEQFWLIARIQMFSILIIELANAKIIRDKRKEEFNQWIKNFKLNIKDFVDHWQNVKTGNKKNNEQ